MEYILDFGRPTDRHFVEVFQQVVQVMLDARNSENHEALKMLERFRQHELSWNRSLDILQLSNDINTRFVVAKVLETCVQEKWKVLAPEYQAKIKGHTQRLLNGLLANPKSYADNKQLIIKLNSIIVAVAKHDWPSKWPTFIQDLVKASMASDTICSNTLDIIKGISEEVFDYSKNNLTSSKVVDLKTQLHTELRAIYTLCMGKLGGCFEADGSGVQVQARPFVARILDLFKRIIHWMPVQVVFDTRLLMALMRCFQDRKLSGHAMRCLGEIAAITTLDDNKTPLPEPAMMVLAKLFSNVMQLLTQMVPPAAVCRLATDGPEEGQEFVHALCTFLTQFLSNHMSVVLMSESNVMVLAASMRYLVEITKADDKDLFSTCLDFWHEFTKDLYRRKLGRAPALWNAAPPAVKNQLEPSNSGGVIGKLLHALRCVVISKMVMPEEILIEKEEETGEIIQRVKTHDTELSALYETCKETLVYLTHLDLDDMQTIMNEYLQNQSKPNGFTHDSLNRLCWAIGSISGTMPPSTEKRFLVTVIKELLDLTIAQKGKANKAVIASNIMYVVGQYPEFLREHWRFLKTVVYKLFEFMKETHPGVQDMACETFLKISKRCSKEFVIPHDDEKGVGEPDPIFILTLIHDLDDTISALERHQVLVFYEAVGCMLAAEKDATRQKGLLSAAMRSGNDQWHAHLQRPDAPEFLQREGAMTWIVDFLRKNAAICKSLQSGFVFQIAAIFEDLLKVYQFYSQLIASRGAAAVGDNLCRRARLVKKEVLLLCESFIEGSNQPQMLAEKILPSLMSAILLDYKQCNEKLRDAAVLSILTTSIDRLKAGMEKYVAQMLSCVFDVTLPMIMTVSPETGSAFTAYPEIRSGFFKLLGATIRECSRPVFGLPAAAFKLVFDSVIQAILHFDRDIHEQGLDMLSDLLKPLRGNMSVCTMFFKNFIQTMLKQLLHVLTDRMHVSGFVKQVSLLLTVLSIVESGQLTMPLFEQFPNNHEGVGKFLMHLIKGQFSQRMDDAKIKSFVDAMQQVAREPHGQQALKFETLMRDFVIELKQFSNQEIAKMNYIKVSKLNNEQVLFTNWPRATVDISMLFSVLILCC